MDDEKLYDDQRSFLTIHLMRSIGFVCRFEDVDGPSRFEHRVWHAQTLVLLPQLLHCFQFVGGELNLDEVFCDSRRIHGFGDRNVPSGFRPSKSDPEPEASVTPSNVCGWAEERRRMHAGVSLTQLVPETRVDLVALTPRRQRL